MEYEEILQNNQLNIYNRLQQIRLYWFLYNYFAYTDNDELKNEYRSKFGRYADSDWLGWRNYFDNWQI
jgi:hypothetical protein